MPYDIGVPGFWLAGDTTWPGLKSDKLTGRELVILKGAGVLRPGDQVVAVPARIAD